VASVVVLYIEDGVVGPHLELLRRVCNPRSKSKPHVTVRYFDKLGIPDEYLSVETKTIDLVEPGSFGLTSRKPGVPRVVYFKCESDDLLPLEHKPHFPASEFHITVYDGKSLVFAKKLLAVLNSYSWGLRIPLPQGTRLTKIQLKSRRGSKKGTDSPREPRLDLERLYFEIFATPLDIERLQHINNAHRLELVRRICDSLQEAVNAYEKVEYEQSEHDLAQEKWAEQGHPDIHLTPPELASAIAEYAVSQMPAETFEIHFGDPAVGNGAFYSGLLKAAQKRDLHIASAVGIDINPEQVVTAQKRWGRRGMLAMQGDYLHMERLPRRNLVLANPPFLRHQAIEPHYKHELRDRASSIMGMRINARSGLHVYFLLLSHEWLDANAISAWLLPAEFMQTAYGEAVRHYLTHRVKLLRIHVFGHSDPQFENAKVLPAVVVFKNAPADNAAAILSMGGTLRVPQREELALLDDLRSAKKWSIPFRRASPAATGEIRIGDLFEVKRGIATGANKYFIMDRRAASEAGLPRRVLKPIMPKAMKLLDDVVESDGDGYPRIAPQLCVLDCNLSRAQIKAQYPRLLKYLNSAKSLGVLDRTLVRERQPWYRQERREPAPFLFTYMGRGTTKSPPLRFIWNKSEAIATNTYLMLYPRAALARTLKETPNAFRELFDVLKETASEAIHHSARMHAEGLHKVEPGELRDVRLARIPDWLKAHDPR
jgi:adenine-specific DNA-methyltransferase